MASDERAGSKRSGGDSTSSMKLIAGFKLVKATLLIAAGFGALGLINDEWQHQIVEWLDGLSLREGRRLTSAIAVKAGALVGAASPARLVGIAIGCFLYGAVFVVEAVGLWLGKRWAEYLTIVVTASMLPFEVFELVDRVTAPRIGALVVNLAVVAYLVWHLVSHRSRSKG